jgi:hypothetical protein
MDVGIGHFVQMCNVGALRSDDVQKLEQLGSMRKPTWVAVLAFSIASLMGFLALSMFNWSQAFRSFRVHINLPSSASVIFDNFPIGLGDSILGIVDTGHLCHRVRGTREWGRSGRLYRRLGFDTKIAKTQEGWHWSPATTAQATLEGRDYHI